jgi:DUF4097 and DUF4098 domain-containing protein YvlB
MEERIRILKMLEDGKITAEEAARLLEALKEKPQERFEVPFHGPRFRRKFTMGVDRIPEIVASTVESAVGKAMQAGFTEKTRMVERKFTAKGKIGIRAVSSDIEIEGWEKDEASLEMSGLGKIMEEENRIFIKAISGDVKGKLPMQTELELVAVSGDVELKNMRSEIEIHTVSGDVELENIEGETNIKSVSGDVQGKGLTGKLNIVTKSGDITVAILSLENGEIESEDGDIIVTLPKTADLILELKNEEGEITLNIPEPLEKIEERKGYVKIGLGNKTGKLLCRNDEGDIVIKQENV